MYFMMILSLFCFTNAMAQFKAYKISNGSKTEVLNGSLLEIEVDAEGKPMHNFLLEIDVKKFREKFKFDVFHVKYGVPSAGGIDGYINHEFDSDISKKKYAGVSTFKVYLFKSPDAKDETGALYLLNNNFVANWQVNYEGYTIDFSGKYITGQDKYYDEKSKSIKMRNVYSNPENIFNVDLKYISSASTKLLVAEKKYNEMFGSDFSNVQKNYTEYAAACAKKLKNVNSNIPIISIVVFIPKYKQIPKAIEEIANYHFELLKAEKDKAKALEMYDNWYNKKGRDLYCIMEYKSNKDKLKKLEKDLKSATSVEQKIELINVALR